MKELNLFPTQENGLVLVENNQVVTTSLKVAEYFGKRHADVLRQVNALISLNAKLRSGYVSTTYIDLNGKEQPMFIMNRDGFVLLSMGFTGKKAMAFKIAYIEAFNRMEEMLRKNQATEYAKMLLKAKVEAFNKQMAKSITSGRKRHGKYYGSCGDMIATLPFSDSLDLESNLNNILAFVNNSYLGSMYFISEMFKKDEELERLKQIVNKFRSELANNRF